MSGDDVDAATETRSRKLEKGVTRCITRAASGEIVRCELRDGGILRAADARLVGTGSAFIGAKPDVDVVDYRRPGRLLCLTCRPLALTRLVAHRESAPAPYRDQRGRWRAP